MNLALIRRRSLLLVVLLLAGGCVWGIAQLVAEFQELPQPQWNLPASKNSQPATT